MPTLNWLGKSEAINATECKVEVCLKINKIGEKGFCENHTKLCILEIYDPMTHCSLRTQITTQIISPKHTIECIKISESLNKVSGMPKGGMITYTK
jgi:hypothetical protein